MVHRICKLRKAKQEAGVAGTRIAGVAPELRGAGRGHRARARAVPVTARTGRRSPRQGISWPPLTSMICPVT